MIFVDTDAGFVPLSEDGRPVPIEARSASGGSIPTEIPTLTQKRLVSVLNRFGPIARFTNLSIPDQDLLTVGRERFHIRSVFKITSENLAPDGTWTHTTCLATAKKRYVLFQVGPRGERTSAKSSAHVIGTLANFRHQGTLDTDRVEDVWRMLPSLADPGPLIESFGLDEPTLQEFTTTHPRDWRALRKMCFSSLHPQGIRPFETLLVPVPLGPPRARLVAHHESDRAQWLDITFHDPDGNPWSVRTPAQIGRHRRLGPSRVQVVPSVREWLEGYLHAPEALVLGHDGDPCTERTVGPLIPMPVKLVTRRVGGPEPHRRRDEEAVLGWDVQRTQQEFSRTCLAPGCDVALGGRQRSWCERHRGYPGTRRKAWAHGSNREGRG